MFFFEKLKENTVVNPKNMNFVIGGVTALVSIFTLLSFLAIKMKQSSISFYEKVYDVAGKFLLEG